MASSRSATESDARDLPSPRDGASRSAFRYGREAAALLLVAGAVFLCLALASFSKDPAVPEVTGANWVGPVGAWFAHAFVSTIGLAAWAIPIELLLIALPLLRDRPTIGSVARIGGDILVILIVAALLHVSFAQSTAFGAMPIGGSIGELFGELLRSLFSTVGSYLVGFTLIGLVLITRASFSFIALAQRAGKHTEQAAAHSANGLRALKNAWHRARAIEQLRASHNAPIPVVAPGTDAIIATDDPCPKAAKRAAKIAAQNAAKQIEQLHQPTEPSPLSDSDSGFAICAPNDLFETPTPDRTCPDASVSRLVFSTETDSTPFAVPTPNTQTTATISTAEQPSAANNQTTSPKAFPTPSAPEPISPVQPPLPDVAKTLVSEPFPKGQASQHAPVPSASATPSATVSSAPSSAHELKIIDTTANAEIVKVTGTTSIRSDSDAASYQTPPFDLLDTADDTALVIDDALQQQLNKNAQLLVTALNHYKIRGEVREILPGPTVTTYELEPEPGTKVSTIAGLADDLAMSLGCQVRIIAPIPGKKRVGFEVPNSKRKAVNLRELIEDRRFQEMKAPLPIVLGRDIVGKPFYADLSSMPHVLVAGATGSGKSVGLNVMLVSLLYRRSPEDLRLLMVDPKVVELQSFDRIPHLLLPVVTDMKQAANALGWAVDEMERRYQLLANAGTKNIASYNAWVQRVHEGKVKGFEIPKPAVVTSEDGSVVEFGAEKEPPKLPEKLPYIVLVVDEFADLMMQQGKEVEAAIARLAQKARAAGMHVILATQRPSVDVITGMIKANFPSRIAYKVTQRNDSRTILDDQGAERLLGKGDMLVKLNGTNDTKRVQCPFVSEEEVDQITSFLRQQGEPTYDESILLARDGATGEDLDDAEQDAKYDEAVQIVAETRRCSTSWIQRKLGIGYNRAAKIVEMMERRGLVGPSQGAKDREVLIDPL